MTPSTARALAFDLDGTVTDSVEACVVALQRAYECVGLTSPQKAELMPSIGLPLAVSLPPLLEGAGLPQSHYPELIVNYEAVYPEVSRQHTKLIPGMGDLVRRSAEHHALGVVTSKATKTAKVVLEHAGLLDCFDAVVGSDLVGRPKPDTSSLLRLCERLNVDAAEALVIGDADVDMQMANAAGAIATGVTWGACSPEVLVTAGASELVESAADLMDLINSMSHAG